jgi:hypothetical protein
MTGDRGRSPPSARPGSTTRGCRLTGVLMARSTPTGAGSSACSTSSHAEGLVRREADPRDRRRHAVSPTPEGKRRRPEAGRIARTAEDDLLRGLDPDEREHLRTLLRQVASSTAPRGLVKTAEAPSSPRLRRR